MLLAAHIVSGHLAEDEKSAAKYPLGDNQHRVSAKKESLSIPKRSNALIRQSNLPLSWFILVVYTSGKLFFPC